MKTELTPFDAEFAGFSIITNRSPTISSKGGTFTEVPIKYERRFKHPYFPSIVTITDYGSKKKKRNDSLQDFYDHYQPLAQNKLVSVICMIVYADKIKNVNDFIKYFKYKKLRKLGIKATSHIRVNDIGDKSLRPHCHVFVVTKHIKDSEYEKIFKKEKSSRYKGIPMNKTFGLIKYCQKKELYVKGNGKSWSASPIFKQPTELVKTNSSTSAS